MLKTSYYSCSRINHRRVDEEDTRQRFEEADQGFDLIVGQISVSRLAIRTTWNLQGLKMRVRMA